jgi:Glycosyl hydrolase family 26
MSITHQVPITTRSMLTRIALISTLVGSLLMAPGLTPPAFAYPASLNPSSGALFGAKVQVRGGESKSQAVQRLENKIGHKIAIDHVYYKWDSAIPMSHQEWDKDTGHIPFLNWTAQKTSGMVRWSAIANGSQDAWIRERADDFRAFAQPVYLTFHHEPENDIGTFGTPAEFAAAFRHIVSIFRERSVTNVAWVWTMMGWTFDGKSGRNAMDYYPGDAYVDFVASDAYNWYGVQNNAEWRSFEQAFATTRAFAVAHNKPWIAAEFGTEEDPQQAGRKAQWIRDVLPTVKKWPELAAVLYFDSIKEGHWATDSSSTALSAFSQLARDPYFNGVGSGGGSQTPTPTPTPTPSPSPSPPPSSGTKRNSLNAGPSGSAVNAGGSSGGGTAFSFVVADNGASMQYASSPARSGLSARHSLTSGGNAYYGWNGTSSVWYGRVNVWLGSDPSQALRLVRGESNDSLRWAIDVLPSGALRFSDSNSSSVGSTQATIATGQWVRIEWTVNHAQGRVEIRLYNQASSSTVSGSFSSSGVSLGSSSNEIDIGRSGTQGFSITFWTDDPAISTSGPLGPA